jgi:hypothetical protein
MVRLGAAALALVFALPLAGCRLIGDPEPHPSASPTAAVSVSPTPTNSQVVDSLAIKESYERSFDELNRLEIAGGAAEPTRVLLDTTSGSHLKNYMKVLRSDRKVGVKQVGRGKLVGVSVGAGTNTRRPVTACEDYSRTKWIKKDGSELAVDGPIRYLQHAVALKGRDDKWRIDSVSTTDVDDFDTSVCGGGKT